MKKTSLMLTLTVYVMTLLSCEKQYTCSCREIDTSTGKTTKTWNPMKGTFTKAEAQTWCHSNETSGFGIRIECSLK